MGLAHVAQPSYLAYSFFGEVFNRTRYAVAYASSFAQCCATEDMPGSFRDSPVPRMERRARRARADACAPFGFGFRRICPPKRFHVSSAHLPFGGHASRVTLPLFRGSGICFGGALGDRALPKLQPDGGRLMHPSPHCCVTKSRARRCQRSAIPPFNGTTILYYTCALTHKGKFRVSNFWFVVSGFRVSGFWVSGYDNAWQVQRGRFLARPSQT